MLILKIAFRNLFRQKRRTLYTALSMVVGFTLASFFIGWADGTYNNIIDTFTRNRLGHIQIHKKGYLEKKTLYNTIENPEKIITKLKNKDYVESHTTRIYSAGLVSCNKQSAGASIIGVDIKQEQKTVNIHKKIIKGEYFSKPAKNEVIIGKGLAKILEAVIGDTLVVVSQGADGSIANDLYSLKGIIDIGDDISNRTAFYLPLVKAQELLVLNNQVHEIALNTINLNKVRKYRNKLQNSIQNPEIYVAPWQEFARSFYLAMKADKEGMWIQLLIVIVIVAMGVLNTVLMAVLERRREYGVLKAMGTKPLQILRLIVTEVMILAFFSIIIGSILGYLVNLYFSNYGISFPEPISYGGMEFKTMKGEINGRSFYLPSLMVAVSALIVSIFPAIKAAKTEPAQSMRVF